MSCPVCTSKEVKELYAVREGVRLSKCSTCGHAFQCTFEEETRSRDIQLEYFGDEFAERRGWFFDLYEKINARRTLCAISGNRNQNVLEIGPGSGSIISCLARAGHQVHGLDLSPTVARHIAAKWGLVVHVESLKGHLQKVGSGYYHLVIMRHVLEHFSDPC